MKKHLLYSFASSSSGNCSLLVCGTTKILIDLGISVQKLSGYLREIGLEIADLSAVLLTHEHSDHIKGIKTFIKRYNIPIYATYGTTTALYRMIPEVIGTITEYYGSETLSVDGVSIETFLTPHDAEESVGFCFCTKALRFGYVTDLGFVPSMIQNKLEGCTTVLLESNYDPFLLETGCYPAYLKQRVRGARGHLSNEDCATFAAYLAKTGTKRFLLAHLSEKNNRPELARECSQNAVWLENQDCEVLVLAREGDLTPIILE